MIKKVNIALFVVVFISFFVANNVSASSLNTKIYDVNLLNQATDNKYITVHNKWIEDGYQYDHDDEGIITPASMTAIVSAFTPKSNSFSYHSDTIRLEDDDTVEFTINANSSQLYQFNFDYFSRTQNILPIEYTILINDSLPFKEASQLIFETNFKYSQDEFIIDRYGNEILSMQEQVYKWNNVQAVDASRLHGGLFFLLDEGVNKITIKINQGSILLGDVRYSGKVDLISYQEYLGNNTVVSNELIIQEAENLTYKNNSRIRPEASKDVAVKPFALIYNKLNIIGQNSFRSGGDRITYNISVEKTGYYYITLKTLQDIYKNKLTYLTVYVNGEIPFEEAKSIPFNYSTNWKNTTLASIEGEKYLFYFNQGENTISFEINIQMLEQVFERLRELIIEINDLGLSIKHLTGNNSDPNRDWDLESFIPGIGEQILSWKNEINQLEMKLREINQSNKNTIEGENLKIASRKFDRILKDVDKLPYNLNLLSEGSGSVTQLLGSSVETLVYTPLSIDRFYLHSDDVNLPRARANIFNIIWVGVRRFFISFFVNQYDQKLEVDEVEIWVNRPRQYVDTMQYMTDSIFTEKTGIKVKFSLMIDDNKLILANAANQQPDVAMNINPFFPYQLALRDALYDFRNFDDYLDVIENFNYESLLPMIHDNGLYGIPETQNFQVLFYRNDILNRLGIEVPNTWDELIDILSELQRYGMNFYHPLSANTGFKIFDTTLPFFFQRNAPIYKENGLYQNLDSDLSIEAITFMTDLYNIYSLPKQVPSFYNDFRSGILPIGIADFATYVMLTVAAPEIKGLWDISLMPGTVDEDGVVNHSATGLAQPMVLFKDSEKKDNAWEFIKWWVSTETQIEYEQLLVSTFGNEYMYNSANINAFELSSWNRDHKAVILEQLSYLKNTSLVFGYYMMEREISNIFSAVVMSGVQVRDAVDNGRVLVTREMNRKNIEFGYMDKLYKIIKPYDIATIEMIDRWVKEDE